VEVVLNGVSGGGGGGGGIDKSEYGLSMYDDEVIGIFILDWDKIDLEFPEKLEFIVLVGCL
jgi:hypothetical protein